jgi:hypothetical protein
MKEFIIFALKATYTVFLIFFFLLGISYFYITGSEKTCKCPGLEEDIYWVKNRR